MAVDERDVTGDWDYSRLQPNIVVGSRCWIERKESFARFRSEQEPGLVLGDGVQVFTWTSFNVEPGGVVEVGEESKLIGGVFMCSEKIAIGRRVIISYQVTIADSDFHPVDPDLRRQDAVANSPHGNRDQRPTFRSEPVVIGDDVCIGIGAIILKGVRIGDGARIEAGAVVTRNVEAGGTVAGNPARPVSGHDGM